MVLFEYAEDITPDMGRERSSCFATCGKRSKPSSRAESQMPEEIELIENANALEEKLREMLIAVRGPGE